MLFCIPSYAYRERVMEGVDCTIIYSIKIAWVIWRASIVSRDRWFEIGCGEVTHVSYHSTVKNMGELFYLFFYVS